MISISEIGLVTLETIAAGSKSEHQGIVLATANGNFELVGHGANPFEPDELKPFAGHKCQVIGIIQDTRLLVDIIKAVDDPSLWHQFPAAGHM